VGDIEYVSNQKRNSFKGSIRGWMVKELCKRREARGGIRVVGRKGVEYGDKSKGSKTMI
jgi:hypothetical protein